MILQIIDKGGIVSWVLLAISIITITIIIVKTIQFLLMRIGDTSFVGLILEAIANHENNSALESLKHNHHPIARTMLQTINMSKKQVKDLKDNIQVIGNIELIRMNSYISWLDTIAHIAPMVGLLGTVVGMIKAFRELSIAGSQVDIGMLSSGIWEALVTTALGLIISVIALIAVNVFESKIEKTRETMSVAINKLLEALG